MEIIVGLLVLILIVLILGNIRVETVLWTLAFSAIIYFAVLVYTDPEAKSRFIALIAFLVAMAGLFYLLKYLLKIIVRKIKGL